MDLYFHHRPRRPVRAVIYSHSHVDHFGGVAGVVSEGDVAAGRVQVLAPEGFLEHAVSENVLAGNAMTRRGMYMYGPLLPKSAQGQVDAGLGKTTSLGTISLIPPTDEITRTGEKRVIDGIEIVFQIAPGTEAPAEMLKYIHDQTLRLANHGATMTEIAEELELPDRLARVWSSRGYYGSVSHDAKAVYQKYLGWYDSNPANLNPLPPVDSARKYVEFMGGPEAVIAKARESFRKGEYRWVAQVMNHVVFADPGNREARELEADALEQLGDQAENATWRNEYLVGASELRQGVPGQRSMGSVSPGAVKAMTLEMFFDYLGVRLDGPKAAGKTLSLNWVFPDVDQNYAITVENGVLIYSAVQTLPTADLTLTLSRKTLDSISLGNTTFPQGAASGAIKLEGNSAKLAEFLGLLDSFDLMFNIVTP